MNRVLFFNGCHRFHHFISTLHGRVSQLFPGIHLLLTKRNSIIHLLVASRSEMSSNIEESRKRKMNEVAGEPSNPAPSNNRIDHSAPRGHSLVIPPGVPHVPLSFDSLERSALNMAAQTRPFSHSHLLNGSDPEGYLRSYLSENRSESKPFDQIVALHSEMLKNELSGLVEKLAEEKAKNTLKQKELLLKKISNQKDFLETKAEIYRNQAEELLRDVKCAEETASSLRNKLKEANKQLQLALSRKNNEPCYVDIITLGPVWLNCRACTTRVATVMMRPCRHICICSECEDVTVACPMCGKMKDYSVEVYLPYK